MNAHLLSRIEALCRECREGDPWVHAKTCIELDIALDAEVSEMKPTLLASRSWDATERAAVESIRLAKEQMAAVGGTIAARCEREHAEDEREALLRQVIAISLANHGGSAKWCAILRGKPRDGTFGRVHALYRMAERVASVHAAGPLVREGVSRTLTPEAYYLRAMILPQVCAGGELDPQQIEIFDSWLWTWVRDYRLTRTQEAGGPPAWIDLASDEGVRISHFVPEGGDPRFLVTTRVPEQLAEVINGFHAGQIYPGFGLSTQMPIEAHVALLDRLMEIWDRTLNATIPSVAAPTRTEHPRVEAFVGLPETLTRGFADASLSIEPPGSVKPVREPHLANVHEISRRWVRVREDTGGSLRLAVDATLWNQVWQGDLIGVRAEGDALPSVGVVSRKFITRHSSGPRVEVQWLARGARKVLLRECGQTSGTPQIVHALYAPGSDNCGQFDSLIVPEATFARDARYELSLADQIYVIRLNRVRNQGRGWIAAGIEVEESRGRAAAPAALRVA